MKSLKEIRTPTVKKPGIKELPTIILLKRKAVRAFPNGKKVALYKTDKLHKYVTIPYDDKQDLDFVPNIQEETEQLDEGRNSIISQLKRSFKR